MKSRFTFVTTSVIIAFSLVCIFFACRRNDFSAAQKNKAITDPTVPLDVKLAKRYYKILKTEQGIAVPNTHVPGSTGKQANTKHPIWQKAYAGETSKATFVEIPLFYNQRPTTIVLTKNKQFNLAENLKILNASFDRLVIFKNKRTGKIDQRIVSYVPDKEYLDKHHDISGNRITQLDKDFKGYLKYRKWDGTSLYLLKIENGKVVNRFVFSQNGQTRTRTQPSRASRTATETCTTYCDITMEQTCFYTITEEFFTEDCSDWEVVDSYCWEECYDDGDGGLTGDPCIDYGECGGDPEPPGDPTPDTDPCTHATALTQDNDFKSKMQDLSTRAGADNHESAYLIKDNNGTNSYSYYDGGTSGTNFNFDASFFDGADGLIHNHENNAANLSVFSPADMQALYSALINPNVTDKENFTFGLVTAQGTVYLLAVDDLAKFQSWGASTLDPSAFATFSAAYNIYIKDTNTPAQNESGFITLLNNLNGGSGLTLMKGNNSFNQWSKLEKDGSGNVFSTNCN